MFGLLMLLLTAAVALAHAEHSFGPPEFDS